MHYIDAHCHLADSRFDGIREAVIARARDRQIDRFIQGGVGPRDWQRQLALDDGSWWLSFGLHPWFVAAQPESTCQDAIVQLESMLDKATALGECGLDYGPKIPRTSHARQRHFLDVQLNLARECDKPLVIHAVQAHGDVLARLRATQSHWRGIVHGFSGSFEVARDYMDLGLTISVGGALTRQGFKKLKSAVSRIPPEWLVVESDAPDMAPVDWNQPLNEPASLWLVAGTVGHYQNRQAHDVLMQSRRNLCRVFDLE